jgi:hypothetical protein
VVCDYSEDIESHEENRADLVPEPNYRIKAKARDSVEFASETFSRCEILRSQFFKIGKNEKFKNRKSNATNIVANYRGHAAVLRSLAAST